jgi:hypothetical protein
MDKMMSSGPEKRPFWEDGPEIQYRPPPSKNVLPKGILILLIVYRILIAFFFIAANFLLFYILTPILAWAWLLIIILLVGLVIYLRKRKKRSDFNIAEIQQRARERSGASVIGSAIHVAGHPLLEREQPVVLALTPDSLKIFRYDDQVPIDIISLNQLAAFHTVVYDDDRTPHIDVVDTTAQALQVTLKFQDKEFTCLFRRMRKVRPIDWYHEIQKARWQLIPQ